MSTVLVILENIMMRPGENNRTENEKEKEQKI